MKKLVASKPNYTMMVYKQQCYYKSIYKFPKAK